MELDRAARPEVVCLCGSMRFVEEMRPAHHALALAGAIAVAPSDRWRGQGDRRVRGVRARVRR